MQSEWVQNLFITQQIQYSIYSSPVFVYQLKPVKHSTISISQIIFIVYLTGIFMISARFVWQLFKLKKVMTDPQTLEAYSFFGNIKIGEGLKNDQSVTHHELVHAQEWHSLDVLLVEMLVIINWFNPAVYLYRLAIKQLHEFIADSKVVKSGINKSDYALLLVSHAFNAPVHQLVNPFFNKSLLKQRIVMLNKEGSHKIMLVKYCLVAPLFILMLVLSSATINNSKTVHLIQKRAEQVFSAREPIANAVESRWVESQWQNHAAAKKANLNGGISLGADTGRHNYSKIYTNVEKNPEFPGGLDAFYKFLGTNIRYPKKMRENNIQGRVIVSFVVEKDGSLTGFKLLRGVEKDGDDETIRVLKLSPKWQPALQKGVPVRVKYTVPVAFTLADDAPGKAANVNEKTSNPPAVTAVYEPRHCDTTKRILMVQRPSSLETVNGQPAPLFLLDGKEIKGLQMVNPDNIQSISVVKDKPAILLYGLKAANGVILISSKHGLIKI